MQMGEVVALLAVAVVVATPALGARDSTTSPLGWKDQHPQQRWRIYSLRLPCYSCMSPYLEDHYPYISHLYRRPMSFDAHCDKHNLDRSYLFTKNCSDMCITLRINDVVGGRRRHGYMRGCLSDLHGYNHTLIRSLAERHGCLETTARELFLPTAQRQELEPSRLALCACHEGLCNASTSAGFASSSSALLLLLVVVAFAVLRHR